MPTPIPDMPIITACMCSMLSCAVRLMAIKISSTTDNQAMVAVCDRKNKAALGMMANHSKLGEKMPPPHQTMQIAAAAAFKNWPNDEMFSYIIAQISSSDDENVRTRMFQAAREFLAQDSDRAEKDDQPLWTALSKVAKTAEEQESIVRGLITHHPTAWALPIITNFYENSEYDSVIDIAERAMDKLKNADEEKEVGE